MTKTAYQSPGKLLDAYAMQAERHAAILRGDTIS